MLGSTVNSHRKDTATCFIQGVLQNVCENGTMQDDFLNGTSFSDTKSRKMYSFFLFD